MIELHKIDNTKILLNSDLIECVEETPDTIITLVTGNKYVVVEKFNEILEKVIDFRKKINAQGISYIQIMKEEKKQNNRY